MNALQDIRQFRRFSQAAITKTRSHISDTQKTSTRSNGQLGRIQQRITRAATTYRTSRSAIEHLAPNEEFGAWKHILRELHREDIRGPGREDSEMSQSRYVISWIWQVPLQDLAPSRDQELSSALRVEWCKAQERAARYEEEVQLVVEEMRQTVTYFEWLACEWERRATTPLKGGSEVDSTTEAGTSAYAYKQAATYHKMVNVFVTDWYGSLKAKSLGSAWLRHYPTPPTKHCRRLPSNVRLYHPTSSQDDMDAIQDDGADSTNDDTEPLDLDSEYNLGRAPDLLEELTNT